MNNRARGRGRGRGLLRGRGRGINRKSKIDNTENENNEENENKEDNNIKNEQLIDNSQNIENIEIKENENNEEKKVENIEVKENENNQNPQEIIENNEEEKNIEQTEQTENQNINDNTVNTPKNQNDDDIKPPEIEATENQNDNIENNTVKTPENDDIKPQEIEPIENENIDNNLRKTPENHNDNDIKPPEVMENQINEDNTISTPTTTTTTTEQIQNNNDDTPITPENQQSLLINDFTNKEENKKENIIPPKEMPPNPPPGCDVYEIEKSTSFLAEEDYGLGENYKEPSQMLLYPNENQIQNPQPLYVEPIQQPPLSIATQYNKPEPIQNQPPPIEDINQYPPQQINEQIPYNEEYLNPIQNYQPNYNDQVYQQDMYQYQNPYIQKSYQTPPEYRPVPPLVESTTQTSPRLLPTQRKATRIDPLLDPLTLEEVLAYYEKELYELFKFYAGLQSGKRFDGESPTMSIAEFIKCLKDFDVYHPYTPINRIVVTDLFRKLYNPNINPRINTLVFEQFALCFSKAMAYIISDHPFTLRFKTEPELASVMIWLLELDNKGWFKQRCKNFSDFSIGDGDKKGHIYESNENV